MKPILGITMGDPYGNGPEVTVKALGDAAVYDRCRPVVIGDGACMRYAAAAVRTRCGIQVQIHPIKAISEALFVPGVIDVYDMELVDEADIPGDPENPQPFGCGPTAKGGEAGFQYVKKVIELALAGEVDATITNAISSVIGLNKLTKSKLVGTWKYDGPGCAFTSQNALAKAGGEVVATQIEQKLSTEYSKLGFTKSNTYITFNEDGTFSGKVDGKSLSGNWTFDENTQALKLSGLLLSLNGYATRNGSGISILFESKKILTLLQTVAALSGNSTLSTIGDISKNYDGVRMGFDMAK